MSALVVTNQKAAADGTPAFARKPDA